MDPKELPVPLEVLERILRLAFEPTDPPSFTPAPSPPRGTSHLLLVSRWVREFCIPHFWRAVTIAQPTDWVTLFGRGTGLLVVGEEGRRRWEWVEELNVVVEAEVPVGMKPNPLPLFLTNQTPRVDIEPSFRRLPRLVFHHLRAEDEPKHALWMAVQAEAERTVGQLVMLLRPPNAVRKRVNEPLSEYAKHILARFWIDVRLDVKRARATHFQRVLKSFRPVYVRLPIGYFIRIRVEAVFPCTGDGDTPDVVEFMDAGDRYGRSWFPGLVESTWKAVRCRLVGFGDQELLEIEKVVTEARMVNGTHGRSAAWSWTRADGSKFTIDFPQE